MKHYIKKIIGLMTLLTLASAAPVSIAAVELGEFCFAGSFQNTGDCFISIEATQHGQYYSLNGLSQCDLMEGKEWFEDAYSGIAFGSGYVRDSQYFNAALRIASPTNSDMTPKAVLFEINLQTAAVEFTAATDDKKTCIDETDCLYDFSIVECK